MSKCFFVDFDFERVYEYRRIYSQCFYICVTKMVLKLIEKATSFNMGLGGMELFVQGRAMVDSTLLYPLEGT